MTAESSSAGGGLLAVLFIGLKLGHVITWPWVWVLSPIWIPCALAVTFAAVLLLGFLSVKAVGR